MLREPSAKRAMVFIDGQNLYHAARQAFGYTYPNYDVKSLAQAVCLEQGWLLAQVRFYTGVPDLSDNAMWNRFWGAKLLMMSRQGVHTYSRPLRYRNKVMMLPDGQEHSVLTGEEKGIDVRIAIDVIRMAHRGEYDVALLFSQDQDLSEVAKELRVIAREQDRWLKAASLSRQHHGTQPPGHRSDGLDSHRQGHLRLVHRSARLSPVPLNRAMQRSF